MAPRILLIRHAEKPDGQDGGVNVDGACDEKSLTVRGWQRAGALIAQQIEKVWEIVGCTLTPGKCVKATLGHKLFPPTEKIVRIQLDMNVAGVGGSLFVNLQTSLAGALVRNSRAEQAGSKRHSRQMPLPALRERLLDCRFAATGELTRIRIPVKDLAQLLFSSNVAGVDARDRVRFWKLYLGAGRRTWFGRLLRRAILIQWHSYRRHNARKKRQATP